MRNSVKDIENIVMPIVGNSGFSLIDVVLRGHQHNLVLEIFVDSEREVTPDACAMISGELSRELERNNSIAGRYTLVVSSPGVDRPLKFPLQYRKNRGRNLRVTFQEEGITKKVQGKLIHCNDDSIQLDTESNLSYTIPYSAIVEARVGLPW